MSQEQELVNKTKSGDREAFDRILTNARSRLENFVRSLMGPGLSQRCDPEDVLQETFLRAYSSIAQFEWKGEESFRHQLD